MQLYNVTEKITKGKQDFQANTFFLANYIKMGIVTHSRLMEFITEDGELEGLRVLLDFNIPDGFAHIGLGQCPTFSKVKFF